MKFYGSAALPDDILLVNGSGKCVVCGEETSYKGDGYWMCSLQCLGEMNKDYYEALTEPIELTALQNQMNDLGRSLCGMSNEVGNLIRNMEKLKEAVKELPEEILELRDEVEYLRAELEESQ